MTRLGVDYSTSRPGATALKAAGYTFACRYLAAGSKKNAKKALTKTEADGLRAAGIDVVSNWEIVEAAALKGRAQGVADAKAAVAKHNACGGPPGRPIYFSVDFDIPDFAPASKDPRAKLGAVAPYFDGILSVLGPARTGAYGGYWAISRLFDAKLIRWGWQAYAWSSAGSGPRPNTVTVKLRGKSYWFDTRAQLRQIQNGIAVNGADCDKDEAVAADFGQWGFVPKKEEEPEVAFMDDENAAKLAWRIDALFSGSETIRGGAEKGQPVVTVRLLNQIKAGQTTPTPVQVDAASVAGALAGNEDFLRALARAVNDDAAERLSG
ncbi:glycoside hydrolase domain-containing protein [Rugosimonospora africana]|uniref:Rv2525c-like glycoside hydrolase-like domain-containing protein n=1 Tax=Rugosimonospora africana TaxID=556532 RepID=A0A8J3R2M1_9ACTN|nr:glycoside hydrolase domain-containing protein [Rugosimonospora africana]GIH20654.1 hypothetical protein Raf01_88260 [Rugosimonospora africana]